MNVIISPVHINENGILIEYRSISVISCIEVKQFHLTYQMLGYRVWGIAEKQTRHVRLNTRSYRIEQQVFV